MKKFSLLLCCFVALLVSQKVWAGAVLSEEDHTLTITTSAAGQVSDMVSSLTSAQKAAITKIVLIGEFNSSDLEVIKTNGDDYSVVTTVDMSEAQFVRSGSSNDYQLFHTSGDANGSTSRYIVGGTLYQWVNSNGWTQIYSTPTEGTTVYDKTSVDVSSLSIGDYGKEQKTTNAVKYLQLQVSDGSWILQYVRPSLYENTNYSECDKDNYLSLYSNGQSVGFRRYYKKEPISNTRRWEQAWPASEPERSLIGNWYVSNHVSNKPNLTMNSGNNYGLDVNYCVDGDYIWFYVYYTKTNGSWVFDSEKTNSESDPWQSGYNDAGFVSQSTWENDHNNLPDGSVVRYKWYFIKHEEYSWNGSQCPTAEQLSNAPDVYNGVNVGADENDLKGYIGAVGAYIWFYHYYTKNDTRNWENETTTRPEEYVVAGFDYAYRDDHKGDYADDQWVQMTDYDYFQVTQTGAPHWVSVDYSNGSVYSIPSGYIFPSNTNIYDENHDTGNSLNQYAIVGNDIQNSSSFSPDYSQMKFSYWSGSIEKAVTSKYANTSISEQIFSNCKNLTEVKYLSGNVTGFRDHKISEGYNTTDNTNLSGNGLSVIIGKDVTQIDNDAFQRCDVLTSLTFADDYTSDEKTAASNYASAPSSYPEPTYPKELTIGNSAFESCFNLSEIIIPNRVTSIGSSAFKKAGNRGVTDGQAEDIKYKPTTDFKVTFERRNHADADADHPVVIDCDFPLTIGNSAFEQCYNLQSLSLPVRLESLGNAAFKNTKGMTNLEMRETTNAPYTPASGHDLLRTIPSEAFQGSHVTEVKIPLCVWAIEDAAFGATNHLETVIFQSQKDASGQDVEGQHSLTIKSGAFAGGNENIIPNLHVYVDIDPTKRMIICEYNAFNFTQMEGQTDENSERRGTLHFSEEYWDYYQGDWKRGLSFSQSSLNAFKDGYDDGDKCMGKYGGDVHDINMTTGKYEYGEVGKEDGEYTPGNGWQMFAGTSTGIDVVIPGGSFTRTYSTNTKYEIPKTMINLVETDLVKVYRVTSFSDGYVVNTETGNFPDVNSASAAAEASRSATAQLVINTSTQKPCYIPKNTGLIMVGNVEENSSYLTYFKERATDDNEPEYPYHQTNDDYTNLLAPTTGEGITSVVVNPTEPYPIWKDNRDATVNYRIFGMAKANYSDIGVTQYEFARMKPNQTMPANRAYLKLPVSMYHWARERMGTGPTYNDEPSSSRSISLLFSDEDNELTGIETSAMNSSSAEGYYTIQGVRVDRPKGKGLFIQNGKKIVVK